MILRVKTDALRVIIVAAHAPHTGADLEEINRFWHSLSAQIPSRYDDWARLLLADANARVGSITSDHIGPHQAETDTEKSEAFRNYLAEEDLWLPATFEDYQTGPGATWKSTSRNDFIGISRQWNLSKCHSWVEQNIDVSTLSEDHACGCQDRLGNRDFSSPKSLQILAAQTLQ